jgi:SnoaL-like domain
MRAPRTFPVSMHVLGDPLITLEPGADRAALDTYAVVYQLSDPGSDGGDLTLGIRYVDEVERLSGRWVIRRRTARTLWMR